MPEMLFLCFSRVFYAHWENAVFDTFANDVDRDVHLGGAIAKALMEKASELLVADPVIEKVDVLAVK